MHFLSYQLFPDRANNPYPLSLWTAYASTLRAPVRARHNRRHLGGVHYVFALILQRPRQLQPRALCSPANSSPSGMASSASIFMPLTVEFLETYDVRNFSAVAGQRSNCHTRQGPAGLAIHRDLQACLIPVFGRQLSNAGPP